MTYLMREAIREAIKEAIKVDTRRNRARGEDDVPDGEASIKEGEGLGPAEDDEDGRGKCRRRDQRAVDPRLRDVPRRRVGERDELRDQFEGPKKGAQ